MTPNLKSNFRFEPWDVDARLRELGLERQLLRRAVEIGFAAFAEGTPNDAVPFPGYSMWAQASRGLRDLLAPHGWRRLNESNQCLVLDPRANRVLVVATGDENTGNRDGVPKTKSKKGPRTIEAVQRNAYLFPEMEEDDPAEFVDAAGDRETWILLMHRDMEAQIVRSELSRPVLMDPERRIGGWSERIQLDSIPFGDIDQRPGRKDSGPKTPEIKVEIKRRA
jgi:hypothetical protein